MPSDMHIFCDKIKAEKRADKTRRRWPGYAYTVVPHPSLRDRWAILVEAGFRRGYVDRPRQQWYGQRRSNLKATWL